MELLAKLVVILGLISLSYFFYTYIIFPLNNFIESDYKLPIYIKVILMCTIFSISYCYGYVIGLTYLYLFHLDILINCNSWIKSFL